MSHFELLAPLRCGSGSNPMKGEEEKEMEFYDLSSLYRRDKTEYRETRNSTTATLVLLRSRSTAPIHGSNILRPHPTDGRALYTYREKSPLAQLHDCVYFIHEIGALPLFSTMFGYIWQSVSTAGGTCSRE